MCKLTNIIIVIFLIILFIKLLNYNNKEKFSEHLTLQSDEAIQNLASLYNNNKITVDRLQLGDKWLLSGVGDGYANDDWLRFLKTDGSSGYYGGIATGKLWVQTDSNGNNTFDGDIGRALNTLNDKIKAIDTKITSMDTKITALDRDAVKNYKPFYLKRADNSGNDAVNGLVFIQLV